MRLRHVAMTWLQACDLTIIFNAEEQDASFPIRETGDSLDDRVVVQTSSGPTLEFHLQCLSG